MKKKGPLFQTGKQINVGAIVSGIGFVLYLVLSALKLDTASGCASIAFSIPAVWTFLSACSGRAKDKSAVSYSLLWGMGALTILLVACGVLTIKQWLGF